MKNINIIKNLKRYILLILFFAGYVGFGQSGPTLEFSAVDKPQPDFPGATDEVTVRMSQNIDNPTNNNFATYDPAVEVTFTLGNYQIPYTTSGKTDFWGNIITDMNDYGNRAINFGYVRETTNLTNDVGGYIVGGVPVNPYNKVSTYGFSTSNATSSSYTSANNPIGQGFDINENYGVQLSMLPYALAGPTANNGSPYNLEGRYYVADLTITFSRPVNNPVLHFAGMGMGINTLRTTGTASERRNYSGYHGWSLEYDFIGNSNVSLTKLSGNDHFDVNSNSIVNNKEYIYTNTQGNYAEGSVQFMGTGITELKFKVFLRSDPGTNGDGSGPYPNIVGGVSQLTKAYAAWGEGSNLSESGNEAKRVAARTGRGNYASISVSLPLAHISGNVFEDTDGDTSINGTGTNGDGLYVNLLDADGNVAKSVAVASDGSYDLGAVDLHSGYQLQLTKNQGTVGAPAPTTELNDNWSTVGESFETTGNDGTPDGLLNLDDYSGDMTKANITTANFGIKMLNPDQDDCTNSGITSVDLNSLFTGTLPDPTVVLQWWTSPTRDLDPVNNPGTKVDDPTNVTESGTYYVFFYDTMYNCYNTDNSTAFVNVTILPPCDDCGDQIFIEDFGTSDKDVNKGRTTSPYMPASNSFTFATPYPDSNISDQTAIDNNHYAVVAPGYIKSGWKPEDLGWYFWTPAYDEPNTVTDMSGTEEGAVMAVNAGETLAPFYRREVTLEYDTYYHAAFSIFVKNATSRVGIKVGNSSSNQVYGMMFSQEFTSVDAGRWIDVELTFKVPANSDVDCDMENVYLEFFNAKAATQGNDYYIDNIFLEKLDVAGACPTPEDFITLVCPADGGSDCTKEPATGTPDGFTKVGISTMEKQTQGWPENIANGFIALDSKEKGFVITRVESESSITDPKEGMLIYDIEDQCVKLHNGEEWSCLNQECSANAGFTLLCNSFIVISGELHAGQWQSLSGILPFANGDGSAFTPLYNIPSEGITGLTVNITHPEGSTITTGTGGFFNVSISGSASAAGIATFPIEINGSSCSIQVEVLP